MATTMRAVRQHGYGGPEALRLDDVPVPVAGPGQLLVRVHAASVNPIDWKLRSGALRSLFPQKLPAPVGQDFAGTVAALGPDVVGHWVGDPVYGMLPTDATGAYAEYVATDAAAVAPKPALLDVNTAAAAPMGALTAWQGVVALGGLREGQSVLVHAAAGNVGGMAVQIARALGADVTAAASAEALDRVRRLGPQRAVAYADGGVPEGVAPGSLDIVFDTLGGAFQAASWRLLRPGGVLVSTIAVTDPDAAAAAGVRAARVGAVPDGAQLRRVAELIDDRQVTVQVGRVLPLDRAAEAQELNRSGAVKGKVVISVG